MKTLSLSWFADRRRLRGLALGFVFALLFAQLAVAAHACTSARVAGGPGRAVEATEMPCADHMTGATADPAVDGGNVCAEHCKGSQQNHQPATLDLPAAALALRYVIAAAPAGCAASPQLAAATPGADAPAGPPHAILHCVRRT
jgi:hypothetical protein